MTQLRPGITSFLLLLQPAPGNPSRQQGAVPLPITGTLGLARTNHSLLRVCRGLDMPVPGGLAEV